MLKFRVMGALSSKVEKAARVLDSALHPYLSRAWPEFLLPSAVVKNLCLAFGSIPLSSLLRGGGERTHQAYIGV